MKTDLRILLVVLIVSGGLPILLFGPGYYFKEQEIQFHDKYFVFNPFEFALVPLGLILFVTFLVRAIQSRFKSRWANLFLLCGAVLTVFTVVEIFEIINAIN